MKCENCGSDFTFWMALKQGTPFRFKCSKCKARYKVSTPRMKLIFLCFIHAVYRVEYRGWFWSS